MSRKQARRNPAERLRWQVLGTIESNSKPDTEYEITRHRATGTLHCPCLGYVFSKSTPKTCAHLRAYAVGAAAQEHVSHVPGRRAPATSTVRLENETFTFRGMTLTGEMV